MSLPSPIELGALGTTLLIAAGALFYFVPAMIKLAAIIGAAGGAAILSAGLAAGYESHGVDKQLAKDKPIMAACVTDKETAISANVTLAASIEPIKAERVQQNLAVKTWQDLAVKAIAQRDALQRQNKPKTDDLAKESEMARARAFATTPEGLTCEKQLSDVTDRLRAVATDQLRYRPNQAPGSDASGVPASGARPDPGAVPQAQ